jgi:hypothetical protein
VGQREATAARRRRLEGFNETRADIVGAGQSGAEVTDHLRQTFTDAEICAVFAKYGYTPADDSSFASRIFDPAAVDHFSSASRACSSTARSPTCTGCAPVACSTAWPLSRWSERPRACTSMLGALRFPANGALPARRNISVFPDGGHADGR